MAKDRREYYKEWRKKNVEKVKTYLNAKYPDYAQYSANYRMRHPERNLLTLAKRRAKAKGIEFAIEEKDIDIPILCPILGIPIVKIYTKGKSTGPTPNSPSLDRIDNSKGYIKGNVKVISHKANSMKHTASREDLIKFANWIMETYK